MDVRLLSGVLGGVGVLLLLLLGISFNLNASDGNAPAATPASAKYFSPAGVPKATRSVSPTQPCVAPLAEIRRNHGAMMKHERDDTMYQGIRPVQHSLTECINCHVSPDAQGRVSIDENPQHFCKTCHTYAAVTIDCFDCHSSEPETVQAEH